MLQKIGTDCAYFRRDLTDGAYRLAATAFPGRRDRPAIIWRDRACTYSERTVRYEQWLSHLAAAGIRAGDSVGVLADPRAAIAVRAGISGLSGVAEKGGSH